MRCGVGLVYLQQGGQRIATYTLAKRKMPVNKLRHFVRTNVRHLLHGNEVGALCPGSQSGCVVTNVISYAHRHAVFGGIRLAVIHDTSICSDKRVPEMPPLSEVPQSVAQSLLIRGRVME